MDHFPPGGAAGILQDCLKSDYFYLILVGSTYTIKSTGCVEAIDGMESLTKACLATSSHMPHFPGIGWTVPH